MLVLTRKSGEALRIGPDVRIRVLVTARGQVRLGVEAPSDLLVLRDELYEQIVEANRESAARESAARESAGRDTGTTHAGSLPATEERG